MKQKFLLKTMLLLSVLVVGSSNVWADTTVSISSFSGTSGSIDSNISYAAYKGTGTTDPVYTKDYIRIYKPSSGESTGGYITITAASGYKLSSVTITNADDKAGTIKYNVDEGSLSSSISLAKSASHTVNSLEATSIAFYNCGSDRLSIAGFSVTYASADKGEATTVTIDASGINNNLFGSNTDGGSLSATVLDNSSVAIGGATVTWSGDDDDVATINASTGAITLVGTGSVNLKATYAGVKDTYKSSNATYKLTVINEDPSLVEIWSEDFATLGYDTRTSTYSYATTNSSAVQSSDNYAGGDAPEMMLKATGGTFSATIPLNNGYTGDMKMKFKSNANTITVSSGTTGVSMSGTASFTTKGTHEVTFTGITAENTNINVVFTAGTSNVRLDDIVLKGKEAPARPTFSEAAKIFSSSFDMTISSETGTTLKYTTDGTNPAVSGTATSVASNSKTITISGTSDVTVKAIAIKDEVVSAVASVTYTYDSRPAPTFTLSDTEMTIYVLSEDETITLTTNSDGAVTFESSNDAKLDVDNTADSKVGVMTAIEAGDYTVTVRTAATVNYLAGEGTVTVHVIKLPTTITTTASFASTDLKDASSGSFTGVAKYNDAAIVGAEVTYSSSNTKVATINPSTGAVTYLKAGTTRLTASYEGTADYAACEAYYDLTLTDSRPQETEVNITFGNALYGTSYSGAGAAGNGPFEGSVSNVDVTVAQGTSANLYITDSETRIYGGTTNGTITITAPTGYLLTQIAITKGSNWSVTASPGTLSTATWTGAASSVVFSASARSDFQSAKITLAPAVTVTAAGYATYASDHDLDFTDKTIKAYIAITKGDGTGVTFTQIDKVPAGTGVLLYKDGGTTEAIPVFDPAKVDADATTGNKFVRGTGAAVATDGSTVWNYILNNVGGNIGFYKAAGNTVAKNRAYISILKSESAAIKEFISLDLEDAPDGISLTPTFSEGEGEIYNLAGQRLQKMQKGINIVNGKKVLF